MSIYNLLHAAGILFGFLIVYFISKKENLPFDKIFLLLFFLTIFMGLGGKIGGFLFYGDSLRNLFRTKGETTIFGSFLFFLFFNLFLFSVVLRKGSLRSELILPLEVIYLSTIHFLGKLGCHFAGCCYGVPCYYWFCIEPKPNSIYFHTGIKIFPIQLVESIFLFALWGLLLFLFLKQYRYRTLLPPLYFFLYSVIRFIAEFFRGDYPPVFFSFKIGQILSIILFIISLIWLSIAISFAKGFK